MKLIPRWLLLGVATLCLLALLSAFSCFHMAAVLRRQEGTLSPLPLWRAPAPQPPKAVVAVPAVAFSVPPPLLSSPALPTPAKLLDETPFLTPDQIKAAQEQGSRAADETFQRMQGVVR